MIKNYFKVALRNLVKNKVFSVINIMGLAFGLCCAILIALWVWDEMGYDQFHANGERIYQTIAEINAGASPQFWVNSQGVLAPALNDEVADIEVAIRVSYNMTPLISNGSVKAKPEGLYADSAFFHVFSFGFKHGDPQTALQAPYNIAISEKLALQFFGDENAIGQTLTVRDFGEKEEYLVTGIFENTPEQSTLQFDFVMPYGPYHKKRSWMNSWGNYDDRTFVLLREGANVDNVREEIKNFIIEHQGPESTTLLHLYPFRDIYLKADFSRGLGEGGRVQLVRLFLAIAILILVIACINFMNLATARAGKRAKEVGVRKATGAHRGSLVVQFIGESILITMISVLLAVTLADLMLPFFNTLTEKDIYVPYGNAYFTLSLLGAGVIVGTLAGSYPAITLSAFQPAKVLKGAAHSSKSLGGLRKVLVVFQFTLSIVLIIGTIIIYNQIRYVLDKDLGVAKENILYHPLYQAAQQREAYRNDLLTVPGVQSVAFSNFSPLDIGNTTYSVSWSGKGEEENIAFHVIQADRQLLETFQLKLLQGRVPEKQDSLIQVLVNEEAVKAMGMDEPVGQIIDVWGGKGIIRGVVNDFNHQNLFQKIDPVVIYLNTGNRGFIAIESGNIGKTIADIENIFKKYDQEYPFEYEFVDKAFEQNYKIVVTAGTLSNVFAVIAIVISCLGLFGLASYMTEQRRKETGIRKVFGASVYHLTTIFSLDFLKLVLIAFVISMPLAWYTGSYWLDYFSYRIDITYSPFLIGGLSAFFIALTTVSYHTIRAAMSNPVDALRYE
ncbi:putative ABC transporter permease [Fulvivirga imtechensis AK7]|uniref:Putative ABC transporter permease n=1 Tax=Fulvivirga imtechensis AK7 TaxID=1237149 RepID=L8K1V4_9BACT|nr:ABC transporter permease [Fulvivirga imtechensis]ELR73919.1 putative ABC transporter permease [Fulvivirga imtechensis AK7]